MRYPASEKAEIIQLVEQSHLPAKRTLDKLGVPRATFYRWYDRYREGGPEALADHRSRPDRVWNRIPDDVRRQIIELSTDAPRLADRTWRPGHLTGWVGVRHDALDVQSQRLVVGHGMAQEPGRAFSVLSGPYLGEADPRMIINGHVSHVPAGTPTALLPIAGGGGGGSCRGPWSRSGMR